MTPAGARTAPPASPPTVVAYVGGAGRSGSTLLALLLGQMPGFVAAGGVGNLWERGLRQNYLCGCGVAFEDCAFWTRVGEQAFGGWDAVDVDEMLRLKVEVARYRHWLWHRGPELRPSFTAKVETYASHLARLYRAIRSVSGQRVVIDTSHEVMSALLLLRVPGVEGRIIHLVRDSRAVAYSLSRRVVRAESTEGQTLMPRYAAAPASLEWVAANVPFHLMPIRALPRLRVNYEALTAAPANEIQRVAAFSGQELAPVALAALRRDSVTLSDNHMVSGNPHRLGRTSVRVRIDDEWRRAMPSRDRLVVTALTAPLALAYGYVGPARRPTVPSGASVRLV